MEPPQNKTCCAPNSFSVLLLICWLAVVCGSQPSHHHVLEPRQSSDGCGQNPLVALVSYAREFADFSPQQLVRFIETDRRAWGQLRSLLKTYDDCVRTGDGTRYKRPSPDDAIPTQAPIDDRAKLRDNHESWKRILRSLVLRAAKVPAVEELSNSSEAH